MHETTDKGLLGFWIYLMTDLLMFAIFFATFIVLRDNTAGGITISQIFNPPFILAETLILLTSSFTCGLATLAIHRLDKRQTLLWLFVTLAFGCAFLGFELTEFSHLISEGNSWARSAFLSSFFTLIGVHGIHITVGVFWLLVMMVQITKHGFTKGNIHKLSLFSLFWHFLDIVWIFIFTIVYLFGGIL
jgi:cytochrome o ubiquinol oxidase subunit 3